MQRTVPQKEESFLTVLAYDKRGKNLAGSSSLSDSIELHPQYAAYWSEYSQGLPAEPTEIDRYRFNDEFKVRILQCPMKVLLPISQIIPSLAIFGPSKGPFSRSV
jgi:hypothetical protein